MSSARILLLRDFQEDRRTSMEIYGDRLTEELRAQDARLHFHTYRPQLAPWTRRLPTRGNLRMRVARYLDYPRQARTQSGDLFHILDHGYAHLMRVLDPRRTLVTVHDIIPLLAGRNRIPGVRASRPSWLAEWTARFYPRAAHLIAVSESTKRDLITYCGCEEERISVIYYGIDPRFVPLEAGQDRESLRRALGLPPRGRLILTVGEAFYKNQETSLRVLERLWSRMGEADLFLVRLGCLDRAPSRREAIIDLDFLPPAHMPRLYQAVDALLFPSWYEGFGWPPVEAMACGTPVVASQAASLPEAVGAGGLLASPDDVAALAHHLERLLTDPALRRQQIQRGFEQAARFRWEDTARQVLACYRRILA